MQAQAPPARAERCRLLSHMRQAQGFWCFSPSFCKRSHMQLRSCQVHFISRLSHWRWPQSVLPDSKVGDYKADDKVKGGGQVDPWD